MTKERSFIRCKTKNVIKDLVREVTVFGFEGFKRKVKKFEIIIPR